MNIVRHNPAITRQNRNQQNKHKSVILWFTGLSGSGKSTLAHAIEECLHNRGCRTYVLDGDNVRHGLSSDLGFSQEDRTENIRRIGETAKLMMEAGIITLAAFISPYRKDRELARNLVPHGDFIEVYCKAKLATCEIRDVKGLYKKVRSGEIENYTGIDSPYEHPLKPEIVIDTDSLSLDESVKLIMQLLNQQSIVKL